MDRISQLLIKNLAAADLLIIITSFVPMLTTLIGRTWVLGDSACSFLAYAKYLPFAAEVSIVTLLACYRLHLLLRPNIGSAHTQKTFKVLALACWICTSLVIYVFLFSQGLQAYFNPEQLMCTVYNTTKGTLELYYLAGGSSLTMALLTTTLVANILTLTYILYFTQRLHLTLPNKGAIMTIIWICWTLLASYVPEMYNWYADYKDHDPISSSRILLAAYFMSINPVGNVVIVMLLNKHVKWFVQCCVVHVRALYQCCVAGGSAAEEGEHLIHQNKENTYPLI